MLLPGAAASLAALEAKGRPSVGEPIVVFVLGWRQLEDFSNEDGYGHVTMSQICTAEGPSNFMKSELCIHMWPFVAGG